MVIVDLKTTVGTAGKMPDKKHVYQQQGDDVLNTAPYHHKIEWFEVVTQIYFQHTSNTYLGIHEPVIVIVRQ